MTNKILGYIFLAIGLLIILGTVWQSYNIFTGKILAPEIFKVQSENNVVVKNSNPLDLQAQLDGIVQKQLKDMIPADALPKMLNLISWSIFAGILIFAGISIAGIGTKLFKN